MKLKALATIAAVAIASFTTSASADETTPIFLNGTSGPSFTSVLLGTIHITNLSDLVGNLFAGTSVATPYGTFTLSSVTFSGGSVGSLTDLDATAAGFSFHNVAAGDYQVFASGTLTGGGQINGALIGAHYNVTTPVPEPETFAMLLAGLGMMGAIARRHNKNTA